MALEIISEVVRDMETGKRVLFVRRGNSSTTGSTSSSAERTSDAHFDMFLRNINNDEPTYFFIMRRARMQRYDYFQLMSLARQRFHAHYMSMLEWRLQAYSRYRDIAETNLKQYRKWRRAGEENLQQYRMQRRAAEAAFDERRVELKTEAQLFLKQVMDDKSMVKKRKELAAMYTSRKPFAEKWTQHSKTKFSSNWLKNAGTRYGDRWVKPRVERKRVDMERAQEKHEKSRTEKR